MVKSWLDAEAPAISNPARVCDLLPCDSGNKLPHESATLCATPWPEREGSERAPGLEEVADAMKVLKRIPTRVEALHRARREDD